MKTYKLLGLLLSYPQPEWLRGIGEGREILRREGLLKGRPLTTVLALIDRLGDSDPYELQEDYVATFDRGRAHSLHLFEHIHGESRDRGQAMVNLAETYAQKGLVIERAELPDYLPLFLEFLSCCTAAEAASLLAEPLEVIAAIGERLRQKASPYAAVFDALVDLSGQRPHRGWMRELLAATPIDESLESLDREWEEAGAFARPDAAGDCRDCTVRKDELRMKLTR
ncbi:MAG: nitrate reductase molybdenum cofactor assembly chaperone [Lysobacterales bacterium]|jgi:nitrate reductase delta subunit